MTPSQHLTQLREKSGLTPGDFAACLGMSLTSYKRFESGRNAVHEGIIADAHQVLADIDWTEAAIAANPEMLSIHPKIFKLLLDPEYGSIYNDDTQGD